MLLQKYSQLPTPYNTLEDGEGVLTLIIIFLPSHIPIFKKFFGRCPVCFWKCAAYMCFVYKTQISSDWQIMCGSRKYPSLPPPPPPRIFHSSASSRTPPPHSPPPRNFQNFWTGTSLIPPSEIQSGFSSSKRRKWIPAQLWNTVEFYYDSVNFCQAYYSAKLSHKVCKLCLSCFLYVSL